MPKRLMCIVLLIIVTTGSSYYAWYSYYSKPRRAFQQLLSGNDEIVISSITITGQGLRLEVSDPESTQYLTTAFRTASRDSYIIGTLYYASVQLSSHGSVTCALYISADGCNITVSFPIDALPPDSHVKYLISFLDPIPRPLSDVLDRLRGAPLR